MRIFQQLADNCSLLTIFQPSPLIVDGFHESDLVETTNLAHFIHERIQSEFYEIPLFDSVFVGFVPGWLRDCLQFAPKFD